MFCMCDQTWIDGQRKERQELGKKPFVDILAHLVKDEPVA